MQRICILLLASVAAGSVFSIDSASRHTATVILLPGNHGGECYDLATIISKEIHHVRWVISCSKHKLRHRQSGVSNVGYLGDFADEAQYIQALIEKEHKRYNIPYNRIVLGGFDHGGSLSLWAGLQFPHTLGGIVCISGYLPRVNDFQESASGRHTPVLHLHDESGNTVSDFFARVRREAVITQGHPEGLYIFSSIADKLAVSQQVLHAITLMVP